MIFIVWVDNIMTPVVGGFGLGRETTQIFFWGEIISVSHGKMVMYPNQDFMVHVLCKLLSTAQMEPEPVRSWKKVSGFHTSIYKPVDIFIIDICFGFFQPTIFQGRIPRT